MSNDTLDLTIMARIFRHQMSHELGVGDGGDDMRLLHVQLIGIDTDLEAEFLKQGVSHPLASKTIRELFANRGIITRLFILSRLDHPDDPSYDVQDEVVVRAYSEEHARSIADEHCGGEGKIWTNPEQASCDVVSLDGDIGVICRDYHGG